MAQFSHKNAYIEFASVDLSGASNTCELTVDVGTGEITCFGDEWDEFVEDIASWSISIAGFTDQDAGLVEDTLFAARTTGAQGVDYRPMGFTSGYKFTGDAIMTSLAVGGGLKGGCAYSATLQGSGALTRTSV